MQSQLQSNPLFTGENSVTISTTSEIIDIIHDGSNFQLVTILPESAETSVEMSNRIFHLIPEYGTIPPCQKPDSEDTIYEYVGKCKESSNGMDMSLSSSGVTPSGGVPSQNVLTLNPSPPPAWYFLFEEV